MTAENFCNWLQGYLELSEAPTIDKDTLKAIKDHLYIVEGVEPEPITVEELKEKFKKKGKGLPHFCNIVVDKQLEEKKPEQYYKHSRRLC